MSEAALPKLAPPGREQRRTHGLHAATGVPRSCTSRSMRVVAVLVGFAVTATGQFAAAKTPRPSQPEPPPRPDVRELYVPFDQLHVVLEEPGQRVLLSREELQVLQDRARHEEERRAPTDVLGTAAEYDVRIDAERAVVSGTLALDVLQPGLHAVPLELSGVGLRAMRLDNKGAPVGRTADGGLVLYVEGVGSHTLSIEAVAPLTTSAARQSLSLQVPTPAATRFRLTVPGDVELKTGAAVRERVFDEKAAHTRFDLVVPRGRLDLVMTLNSRLLRQDRVVLARSVIVDEITQAYERLHVTLSLAVLHRAVGTFRVALPPGFDVTEVRSPDLTRWAVAVEQERRVLDIQLREDTVGTVVVNVAALRTGPLPDRWQLPRVEPLDVVGHAAIVGLLLENRLRVSDLTPVALIPVDTDVVLRALPRSVEPPRAGPAGLRPVAAYYAPQADFAVSGQFTRPPAEALVSTSLVLTLKDDGLSVQGGFTVLPREEKCFAVDFTAPAGWDVTRVSNRDETALTFERYLGNDGGQRVHVMLPQGIPPGTEATVYFTARRVPERWFETWTQHDLAFPVFAAVGAARDTGAIAVVAGDDMRARPLDLKGLAPLDENEKSKCGLGGISTDLAYRYETQPYSADFTVERIEPRLTAETASFFRIERDRYVAHYELTYNVTQARARQVQLTLPAATPAALAIRGLDGIALKEYAAAETEDGRQWTAVLAEARLGAVRIAIDFEQRYEDTDAKELALPIVHADGIDYQSGLVAVEGSAELDVRIVEHPRKVDIGELAEAEYQPGRRLLGAFGFIGAPPPVRVSVGQHPAYPLPPAIVQRAELLTVLAAEGVSQSAARFLIRTKALFLEIKLPADSTLWSVLLDGTPAKPQQEHDSILLDLPAAAGATELRDLQLVYETPTGAIGFWNTVRSRAPRLLLHEAREDAGRELDLADLNWSLHLPTGFTPLSATGTVIPHSMKPPRPAALSMVRGLYRVAGGINPRHGILTALVRTVGCAAQSARMMKSVSGSSDYAEVSVRMEDIQLEVDDDSAFGTADEGLFDDGRPADRRRGGREREAALEERAAQSAAAPARSLPQAAPAPKAPPRQTADLWALQGARSLNIELQPVGRGLRFTSLGSEPQLALTVANRRRLNALAWGLALAAFVLGAAWTCRAARRKATYIAALLLVSTLLPAVPGLAATSFVLNRTFYAGCALVLYYLLAALVRKASPASTRRCTATATAAAVLLCIAATPAATAAEREAADSTAEPYVIEVVQPPAPVHIPDDVLIVPYDPAAGHGVEEAERVLIPRDEFQRLWKLANPEIDRVRTPPPAPFALAGGAFTATLTGEEHLKVVGTVDLEVYSADPVTIPLPVEGGVIAGALLDGKPARLGSAIAAVAVVQEEQKQQQLAQQARMRPAPETAAPFIYAEGPGRHRLELTLEVRLERRGGWRVADFRLPVGAVAAVDLRVPDAATEVRFSGTLDRGQYETVAADELIRTATGADGRLRVEWRPRISEGQVDRSLTVESTAVLDIQEERLELVWHLDLKFRRGEREHFDFRLPPDYLVEKVEGSNVRGWEVRSRTDDGPAPATGPVLAVGLLKPTREGEAITLHLWKPGPVPVQANERVPFPVVDVSDAVRHVGRIAVNKSPMLDVRTVTVEGATRTDLPDDTLGNDGSAETSPLGIRPFQAFTFVTTPFSVLLGVRTVEADLTAKLQSILRIADREEMLETRALLLVEERPLYRAQLTLPAEFEVEQVTAPGDFEWAVAATGAEQTLTVNLKAGVQGEVPVLIRARRRRAADIHELALPRIEVLNVQRQEGDIVVQADPSFNVQARDLRNLESVLLNRVYGWLKGPQRSLARLAFHYTVTDYAASLVLAMRQPSVTCRTVTNVRVTDRALEETILLDCMVHNAGLRELRFRLPAYLAAARISAPLLRQKTVTPVADTDRVLVVLELQDAVMNQLRVLVEHDRLLSPEPQTAPIPELETGRTDRQYVAVESAGRDEVVILQSDGLDPLTREQKEWQAVAGMLRGGATQAFVVAPGSGATPQLVFQTKERTTVETAGARIGLAQTVLVADANGTYRAEQTYHVDNRTEQFLKFDLPSGASLWTARVAGDLVKPVVPDATQPRRIHVPLVKTAAGDLDYTVVLKYGGGLPSLRSLTRTSFPLIRTDNINVELSQVELRLPNTRRWLAFGGTMRRVVETGDFEADVLAYQNRLAKRLVQTLQFGNVFEKARATSNLKSFSSEPDIAMQMLAQIADNPKLNAQLGESTQIMQDAAERLEEAEKAGTTVEVDANRFRMNDAYSGQQNTLARNVVLEAGANWDDSSVAVESKVKAQGAFNEGWLVSNNLGDLDDDGEADEKRSKAKNGAADKADVEQLKARKQAWKKAPQAPAKPSTPQMPQSRAAGVAVAGKLAKMEEQQQAGRSQKELAYRYQQRLEQRQSTQQSDLGVVNIQAGDTNLALPNGVAGPQGGGAQVLRDSLDLTLETHDADTLLFDGGGRTGRGLVSLDVTLPPADPARWAVFRFTTPRGGVDVTARSVARRTIEGLKRLGIALVLLILVGVARKLLQSRARVCSTRTLTTWLVVAGTLGLLFGIFPIAGALALVAGLLAKIMMAITSRHHAEAKA